MSHSPAIVQVPGGPAIGVVIAAASGVGSLAGQFARLRGAASPAPGKGKYLVEELGYDAVVTRDAGPDLACLLTGHRGAIGTVAGHEP
ncbi:hypothetical protein [Streptomyces ehimensis]|uniref:Uncharacterized protein n=1 Tax=Streptomyces ehimensis TaxID=68195 RepID=A0ABV9BRJ7_9ACTN